MSQIYNKSSDSVEDKQMATKPVRLSAHLHRQLKIEAAYQEKKVSELLEEILLAHFGFLTTEASSNQTITERNLLL